MARVAVGDLTLDVEVPERFQAEYSLSGSLLLEDRKRRAKVEISGIRSTGFPAVHAVLERAAATRVTPTRSTDNFAMYREGSATWHAGFGNHLLVATLKGDLSVEPGLPDEVGAILESVAPAHDGFPASEKKPAFSVLRPSHELWFAQRRRSLSAAIDWSARQPRAAERLDDFWEELVKEPPPHVAQLNTMISCATVGFGDLLAELGFEWMMVSDEWGVSIGMVALRGAANVVVVPHDFVAKRWERKELRFVTRSLRLIAEQLAAQRH